MSSPSLRQLDIFAQMAAAGSVARCAEDMGMTPAQVLDGIAALEMRLGYRLFDDAGGAARLTPAGRKTAQALYNRLWGSGFLPSKHQGVALRSANDPVLYLQKLSALSMMVW